MASVWLLWSCSESIYVNNDYVVAVLVRGDGVPGTS